jgi:hypothetical protein
VVCILDAKIVDNEAECDVACIVSPTARGVSARGVAMFCEVCHPLIVSEDACLGKVIHATADFNQNEVIVD